MRSESTSALGHPRLTNPILGVLRRTGVLRLAVFKESGMGFRGKGRHSTPNRPFDGPITLSNARFENRDVLLRKAPAGVTMALKNGRPRPINPLNVVTGPPARRVK